MTLINDLVDLSRRLADQDLVTLAEGNTSVLDGDSFLVKASGRQMGSANADDFVRVDLDTALSAIEGTGTDGLFAPDDAGRKPSIEALMHAVCLAEGAATWVAHTHSPGVVGVMSSHAGADAFDRHLYPDAIVVCGRRVASVPYVSPGRDLAVAVRTELRRYTDVNGRPPKTLLLGNHGLVALGSSPTETLNVSIMAEKWSRILATAIASGGPRYLTDEEADEIDGREDEGFRRVQLLGNDNRQGQ